MDSHSPSPSSGRDRSGRSARTRTTVMRYASQLQTEAYLLARDTVRRVQRTSALVDASLWRSAQGGTPGDRHRLH